jgi:DNA-binding NarL/FixJ family response regulator
MPIRIFIYDDSDDRRDSLKALMQLSADLEFVGGAPNCSNVLIEIETYFPDVVLMDINMPEVDGIEGLRLIKQKYPEVKVLMQTAFDDSDKIFTSIRNGASGYVLKKDSPQRLLQAIHEVHEGGAVMNPGIAQKVLDFFKPQQNKSLLSPRENEVLALLAEGMSYKMIANQLCVSYSTVNTHTKKIYEKLHVASLGEAIAYYYKNLNK